MVKLPQPLVSAEHREDVKTRVAQWAIEHKEKYGYQYTAETLTTADFVCAHTGRAVDLLGWLPNMWGVYDDRLEFYLEDFGYKYKALFGEIDHYEVQIPTWLHQEIFEHVLAIEKEKNNG